MTVNVVAAGGAVARDDTAATVIGRAATVDVLANDSGERLTRAPCRAARSAAAPRSSPNRIVYTPEPGWVGKVAVGYEARNPIAASRAQLAIRVLATDADLLAMATDDPELRKVARALGTSCERIRGSPAPSANARDLLAVCDDLGADAAASRGIDPALAAIRNEEGLAVVDQVLGFGRGAGGAVRRRIDRLRQADGGGLDVSGLGIRLGGEVVSGDGVEAIGRTLLGGAGGGAGSRWGGFVSGEIAFGSADGSDRTAGSDLDSTSVSIGADYRLSAAAVAGLALSFARAETDFDDGGRLEGTSFQISGYGLYGLGARGLSLAGIATWGFDSFEQTRRIDFTADGVDFAREAAADYSGSHLNLVLELNYAIPFGPAAGGGARPGTLTFSPAPTTCSAASTATARPAPEACSLQVDAQRFESLVLTAGAELSRAVPVAFGILEPSAALALNAELLDDTRSLSSSFAPDGVALAGFSVEEDGDQGLFATLELGSLVLLDRGEVDLRFATDLGRSSLDEHRFSASFLTRLSPNDDLGLGLAATRDAGGGAGVEASAAYRLRF